MNAPGKSKKKKQIPVKTSLNNPYSLTWTPLNKGIRSIIIKTLKEKIESIGLRKTLIKVKKFRSKGKVKRGSEPTQEHREAREPGWSDEAVRRQLFIGINEVTKGLEKDDLSLVLVCSSARPAHMTSHLIPLSRTRAVPACQVPDLSEGLSGLLGLSSVLALGFRRGAVDFADTVGQITGIVPPLHVAWMPAEKERTVQEDECHSDHEQCGESHSGPVTGIKRKRDLSLDPTEDSLSLQPLKVKKTIPNPSKLRKTKKTTK